MKKRAVFSLKQKFTAKIRGLPRPVHIFELAPVQMNWAEVKNPDVGVEDGIGLIIVVIAPVESHV